MPGRTQPPSGVAGYRYGFNGKENDIEIFDGVQDYGMRMNDVRLGRFFSVDPIAPKYPELTPYQFASNTPIQAIDLDGLEAFFIHGTWGNNSAWLENGKANELTQKLTSLFGNNENFVYHNKAKSQKRGVSASWSGGNYDEARQQAALELVAYIKEHLNGEPITLVGHSHGGNVAILVANILAADPELEGIKINLLTMNTPARDYQLSFAAAKITTHYQVYNTSDVVQTSGGNSLKTGRLYDLDKQELFGAGREFLTATNIKYDSPAKWYNVFGNHQGWQPASSKVWLPQLEKEIKGQAPEGAGHNTRVDGGVLYHGNDGPRKLPEE